MEFLTRLEYNSNRPKSKSVEIGTKCIIVNCENYHKINGDRLNRGLCKKHYQRFWNRQRQQYKNDYLSIRIKLINALGGKCVRCGNSDYRCLQLDHINGHGNKERKLGNSASILRYYNKHQNEIKSKFQLLCANCNWIKRYENNEHGNLKYQGRN